MNTTLLSSIKTVTRKYDTALAVSLFHSIISKNVILRLLFSSYRLFRKTPISTFFILAFGARILLLRKIEKGDGILAAGLLSNELRKINILEEALPHSRILKVNSGMKNVFILAQWRGLLESLLHPRAVIKGFKILDRINRRQDKFFLSCIAAETIAYHCLYSRILSREQVSAVFFASDYTADAVPLVNLAKHYGIPTIFMPHANVTKAHRVPPLRYSLSVLTGRSVLEIYESHGRSTGEAFLLGICEPFRAMNLDINKKGLSIGLFLTSMTDEKILNEAVLQCISVLGASKVIIRPHPSKLVMPDFGCINGIPLSEAEIVISQESSLHENLKSVDLVIAGNSSVHLETLRFGVPSLYLQRLDTFPPDINGFVQRRILMPIENVKSIELEPVISFYKSDVWQNNFRTYDAGYGISREELVEKLAQRLKENIAEASHGAGV